MSFARRVTPDRVISTVDPQARHGRKTSAHGFDGYKGHLAVDPDSEIITATTVTAGNTADAAAASGLITGDLSTADEPADRPGPNPGTGGGGGPLTVYGDSAYGAGALLAELEAAGRGQHVQGAATDRRRAGSPRTPSPSTCGRVR